MNLADRQEMKAEIIQRMKYKTISNMKPFPLSKMNL